MRRAALLIGVMLCASLFTLQGQQPLLRVVSYNVENLFDTLDDPGTDDKDFTPTGAYAWTEKEYKHKLNNIARVISDMGEWQMPALVALCEVENKAVLEQLLETTPLRHGHYRAFITEGGDPRGIDVALLVDTRHFTPIRMQEIAAYAIKGRPLVQPAGAAAHRGAGRHALWATLRHRETRTELHLFIAHLPSRRGGTRSTDDKRIKATRRLRTVIDSLLMHDSNAKVLVMGDFNDNPTDPSIKSSRGLGAEPLEEAEPYVSEVLYNLAYAPFKEGEGSHYHGKEYWMPDQIIASGTLLQESAKLRIATKRMQIYRAAYLFGKKRAPKRSFVGTHYQYGYSDHLPVFIDLTY